MGFSIDLRGDDAQAKAQAMTDLFKREQAQQKPTPSRRVDGASFDFPSGDRLEEPGSSNTAELECLPSGQMPPATGLFMTQGVQAVCCAFHAAQLKRG